MVPSDFLVNACIHTDAPVPTTHPRDHSAPRRLHSHDATAPTAPPGSCSAKVRFENIIRDAQNSICAAVSKMDGKEFHEDAWTREDGGGGISRVLQDGNVWEKAGVNVSVVYGSMPPTAYRAATERNIEISPDAGRVPFFAAGISSVMHPRNPHAPTMHFNYRCGATRCGVRRGVVRRWKGWAGGPRGSG